MDVLRPSQLAGVGAGAGEAVAQPHPLAQLVCENMAWVANRGRIVEWRGKEGCVEGTREYMYW